MVRAANVTFIELKGEVQQFDNRLNALDEAQSAVERKLDVDVLEANMDEAAPRHGSRSPCPGRHKVATLRLGNYTIQTAIDGRKFRVRCLTDAARPTRWNWSRRVVGSWCMGLS